VVGALEPSLSRELVSLIADQKVFLPKWGFTPNDFSIEEWVAFEPLAEALQRAND
jgi:hypothetical protein